MADRPILFSASMVRALLAGTKTQTRRQLYVERKLDAGQPIPKTSGIYRWTDAAGLDHVAEPPKLSLDSWWHLNPLINLRSGDRLWVRERWAACRNSEMVAIGDATMALMVDGWQQYPDGHSWPGLDKYADGAFDRVKWRPGIHMPRWASRLTLHVTEVRVQRLQKISEVDARSEGASFHDGRGIGHSGWRHDLKDVHADARSSYARLWDDINGADSWDLNPWVVAITFTVERCNIGSATP